MKPRFRFQCIFIAGQSLALCAVGCSSSSSAGSLDAGMAATDGQAATTEDATTGSPEGSVPAADAQASTDASAPEVDASAACRSYCTCMAMNCPAMVFGSGCLYECATQTNWDLTCRANMCTLVPSEPNNNHCTHAVGVGQCLDE